jgi:hypothetical protein
MSGPVLWETFNEWYSAEVDQIRAGIRLGDNRYDPQTDTIRGVSVKKAEYYHPPPELVEFCKTAEHIIKPYANKLMVKTICFHSLYDVYWDQDVSINYMDWMGFLYDITRFVYINCNPQSVHYGNIMICSVVLNRARIAYKNIRELITDICEWLTDVGEIQDFNVDEYLNSPCVYCVNPSEWLSCRDILLSDDPVVREWIPNVNWEIRSRLKYKDFKTRCFSDWAWTKHVKN